jgi:hypothetical protein
MALSPMYEPMLACILASTIVASGACSPECTDEFSLVDQMKWSALAHGSDPFADGRPQCVLGQDMFYEDFGGEPSFTIQTQSCSWGTVEQPSALAVKKGEMVTVRIWYFPLTDPSGTVNEGRVLIAFGNNEVWKKTVPIPTHSGLIKETFAAPSDLPLGARIRWNISNHGENSWNLLQLTVSCVRDNS